MGVFDLTLHNYGPNKIIGTAHVEVPDDTTAKEIHKLSRLIAASIYEKFGIILTIGVYAAGNTNPAHTTLKTDLERIIAEHPEVLQMHAFYVDEEVKTISFDLIIDFKADAESIKNEIVEKISALYPEYRYFVVLDTDFSE